MKNKIKKLDQFLLTLVFIVTTMTLHAKDFELFMDKNGKYGIKDSTGKIVVSGKYDSFEKNATYDNKTFYDLNQDLIAVNVGGKWVSQGAAFIKGKWGFIDRNGKEVTPIKYDRIIIVEGSQMAAVNVGCKWNGDGFDASGTIAQCKDGKWGYIDASGKEITEIKYDGASTYFQNGLAVVNLNGKMGFVDQNGKEIIELKYDMVNSFDGDWAAVQLNGKWGFIDGSGKEVIPCIYTKVEDFKYGLARVMIDTKVGFIDRTGKVVIEIKYDFLTWAFFIDGLLKVVLDDKHGFVDKNDQVVIPLKYDYAWPFFNSQGLARVKLNEKYGYVDKTGNEVIPIKYDWANDFRGGKAEVELDGKKFYIDKSGNEIK